MVDRPNVIDDQDRKKSLRLKTGDQGRYHARKGRLVQLGREGGKYQGVDLRQNEGNAGIRRRRERQEMLQMFRGHKEKQSNMIKGRWGR